MISKKSSTRYSKNGIAGICGGRIAVRQKLGELSALSDAEGHTSVSAQSTYNHPNTELAYAFDETEYGHKEAQLAVIASYDCQF